MKDEQYSTDIKVSKTAVGGGKELTGAKLTVKMVKTAADETVDKFIDSWTSNGSSHELTGLKDGTYTLTENQAPLGYQTAESITFEIKEGKLVESENAGDGTVTMKDEQYKTDIKVSKTAVGGGEELPGAKLTVKMVKTADGQAADELIENWISDGTVHEIQNLLDGTYTLTEDQAPLGYKTAESITFIIQEGKLIDSVHVRDGVVVMQDEQYKTDIKVSKVAAGGGEELPGAELTVKDEKGGTVASWTSDGTIHEIKDLIDGTYTLTENQAPLGYQKAESITFEIKDGKLVESEAAKEGIVTMEDAQYKGGVSINKVSLGQGAELSGAKLTVKDSKDNVIASWTSDGTNHEISDLVDGTYTLTEDQAPLGYKKAESITFEMKEGKLVDGSHAQNGVVTMEDEQYKTDIKVSKVAAGGGEELPGAELTVKMVKNADDTAIEGGKLIDDWTSSGSAHEIAGLADGTYTLTEDQAPLGYKTAETITFEIKEGKLVESENAKDGIVTMEDKQSKTDIQVSKVAAGGGEELPGAELSVKMVKNAGGEEVEEEIDRWTSDGSKHEIKDLADGTYTLTEDQAPLGYKTAETITFEIKREVLLSSPKMRRTASSPWRTSSTRPISRSAK